MYYIKNNINTKYIDPSDYDLYISLTNTKQSNFQKKLNVLHVYCLIERYEQKGKKKNNEKKKRFNSIITGLFLNVTLFKLVSHQH